MTPKAVGDGDGGWGRWWHHSLMSSAQEEHDVGETMGSNIRGTGILEAGVTTEHISHARAPDLGVPSHGALPSRRSPSPPPVWL